MFEVRLDNSEVLLGAEDAPAGRIWMVLGGVDFPDERWSDFPISVLGSAVDALTGLAGGEMEAFSYFFDGPYYVYYKRLAPDSDLVRVEATTDRSGTPELLAVTEVRLGDLWSALLQAAESSLASGAERKLAEGVDGPVERMVETLRATKVR